ncbi:MAG TPA: hypothetical protein VM509_14050 [Planctomycetota bacterium]|nr:hypothetical protein [Planctomycetota bacterium]
MTRTLRLAFFGVAALSFASAILFAFLRFLLRPTDDLAAYNHPAQPWALDVHVVSSIALTFVLGVVFGVHALPRLRVATPARATGLFLLASAAAMIASGALLPCSAEPLLRAALGWTHGIAGSAFVLALPLHLRIARRAPSSIESAVPGARRGERAAQGRGWLRRAPTPRSRTSAATCQPLERR